MQEDGVAPASNANRGWHCITPFRQYEHHRNPPRGACWRFYPRATAPIETHTMNAYAQIAALEGAQRQYDNACPEESAWIYTDAGEDWLQSCHRALTRFEDVRIDGQVKVKHGDFVAEFAVQRAEADAEDDQFSLDIALIKGERCTKYDALRDRIIHRMCIKFAPEAEKADRDLKAWLER